MTGKQPAERPASDEAHAPTFAKVHALTAPEVRRLLEQGVKWLAFPDDEHVMLVHVQGDESQLSARVKLKADAMLEGYAAGCFPYPDQSSAGIHADEPAAYFWHRPSPRTVFLPDQFDLRPELRRSLRTHDMTVNQAFGKCVVACAKMRRGEGQEHSSKPWINYELIAAYHELHERDAAFSIEARGRSGEVVGGLLGVRIGRYVTVESMFREAGGTSKPAFAALLDIARRQNLPFVDVQLPAAHWTRWGAVALDNTEFQSILKPTVQAEPIRLQSYEKTRPSR